MLMTPTFNTILKVGVICCLQEVIDTQKILVVGLGGFIGASLRYIISKQTSTAFGGQFPYGTLIVNVVGGLLIGFILELTTFTDFISPNMKIFLTTGIMGGLTTFSTFSFETITFETKGSYILASINIVLNLALSLLGVVGGKILAHVAF
jgi:CrcB protein